VRYSIEGRFVLAKAEEKGKVNLYTLLDGKRYEKMVLIGTKITGIEPWDLVDVEIDLTIKSERIETIDGKIMYLDVVQSFLKNMKKVGK